MSVRRTLWSCGAVLVLCATMAAELGHGATSRVVDRTLVCRLVAPLPGVRDLDVVVALPFDGQGFSAPAFIGVSSGPVSSGPFTDRANRVFVRARNHELGSVGRTLPAGVYANTRSCAPTRAAVPLSPRGLPGPPVRFEQEPECTVRGRVLVRVRAFLQVPARWVTRTDYAGAQKNVVEAALAVRSERTRRPIAFIQLGRSGTTKLWSSRACE
jgi:hypothetical protein